MDDRLRRLFVKVSVEVTMLKSHGFTREEILGAFEYFLEEPQIPDFLKKENEHA